MIHEYAPQTAQSAGVAGLSAPDGPSGSSETVGNLASSTTLQGVPFQSIHRIDSIPPTRTGAYPFIARTPTVYPASEGPTGPNLLCLKHVLINNPG